MIIAVGVVYIALSFASFCTIFVGLTQKNRTRLIPAVIFTFVFFVAFVICAVLSSDYAGGNVAIVIAILSVGVLAFVARKKMWMPYKDIRAGEIGKRENAARTKCESCGAVHVDENGQCSYCGRKR